MVLDFSFLQFATKQKRKVQTKAFPVMEHMAILKNSNSILYVIEALMNITQKNEEAAAKAIHLEALEKKREKNLVEKYTMHNVHYNKVKRNHISSSEFLHYLHHNKVKKNDISSSEFWKAINMNVLPNVLWWSMIILLTNESCQVHHKLSVSFYFVFKAQEEMFDDCSHVIA